MVLFIDNYDSFVYNLARYISECGYDTEVVRNDVITVEEISALKPSHILLSPGPCTPAESGITRDVVRHFFKTVPILGVCLGHQAIGQAYGGKVVRARHPMHGKASLITHDEKALFAGIKNPLRVARYHSLIVAEENFPDVLQITARCDRGEIMSLKHKDYPVYGVQFHPESVLTEEGYGLLRNFLRV